MTDRDQVAREVLTEAIEHMAGRDAVVAAHELTKLRDERYPAPAPAAPVTVTVVDGDGVQMKWKKGEGGYWVTDSGHVLSPASWAHSFAERVASDARRIEELEAANASLKAEIDRISAMRQDALGELVRVGHERDEARRALDDLKSRAALGDRDARAALAAQVQAATSQGEGHEVGVSAATCGGSGTTQPEIARSGKSSAAAPSPAPIPLGAVVESVEYAYRFARYTHDWECMQGDPPVGHPVDVEVSALCTALYRALHPVADAATVERVARAILDNDREQLGPSDWEWNVVGESVRGSYLSNAHAALRALGYTIQEGANG